MSKHFAPALATLDLVEADAEAAVIGALLVYPEAAASLGASLNAEWFADPATRALCDAIAALAREGHRISVPALMGRLSRDMERDGLTRAQLIAHVSAMAVPLAMLSGPLAVLKDRWARRIVAEQGRALAESAGVADLDPHDVIAAALADFDRVTADRSERSAGSLVQSTDELLNAIAEGGSGRQFSTGIRALDEAVGGWRSEQLYVLAGRPGMGKSAVACSTLRQTAKHGGGVAFFSLEMSRADVAARCIADSIAAAGTPGFGDIADGRWTDAQGDMILQAREQFAGLPFHIDGTARLTMPEIASRARSIKARFGAQGVPLAVVCVDHMGLVEPDSRYAGNKTVETGQVSRAGKILAKELGCCVLLLSQLSRDVEKRDDKRPNLADLRYSGDIEQDADVVAFVYREAYYLKNDPTALPGAVMDAENRLELLIRKNRNGPDADLRLWASIKHSAIRDGGRP